MTISVCDILTSASLYPLVCSMMLYLGTEALKLNVKVNANNAHNDDANVTDLTSCCLKHEQQFFQHPPHNHFSLMLLLAQQLQRQL